MFDDIRRNREDGATTLAIKSLRRIYDFISSWNPDEDQILKLIREMKNLRPSMVIISSYAEKIKTFLESSKDLKNLKDFIASLIDEIEQKRKKLVEIGLEIIKPYSLIGVVSFSSILNEIIIASEGKKFFALSEDNHAKRFKKNMIFVDGEQLKNSVEIGIMGADAVISKEKQIFILNGFPSKKFCDILKHKRIFVFAEKEKFISYDVEVEDGFEKFSATDNIIFISV